jgi:hypothetical protein
MRREAAHRGGLAFRSSRAPRQRLILNHAIAWAKGPGSSENPEIERLEYDSLFQFQGTFVFCSALWSGITELKEPS